MGSIVAVCLSAEKGTQKAPVHEGRLVEHWGLEGDAHAGSEREVSFLCESSIRKMAAKGLSVKYGMFAENFVLEGIGIEEVAVGQRYRLPSGAVLEVTRIGKPCHSPCEIFREVGDCIMPREGFFARVVSGGEVKPGDAIDRLETEGR
ncbi:MAG: MOSC domain-containing protein [Planctomycetota bacterium]|jgi:MOSC domain-containing protein YiiM